MSTPKRPIFRKLDRAECEEILARNHVGRIAYARANRVDIRPSTTPTRTGGSTAARLRGKSWR
jgi:nitroimidazol reductase NimA-like FMN-containing flavoprotein (pyridoxamine 5'-phosphate oxidase superfamily)